MELDALLSGAKYWHWAVAGLILLALEVFVPGAIFMWLGIAAIVVAIFLGMIPQMSWEWQWTIFSIVSVVSIVGWRIFFKKHPLPDESRVQPLNERGREMLGRKLTLSKPIKNGVGRTRVGDTWWRIEGPDCPAGTVVVVTGSRGASLLVEPVKEHEEKH